MCLENFLFWEEYSKLIGRSVLECFSHRDQNAPGSLANLLKDADINGSNDSLVPVDLMHLYVDLFNRFIKVGSANEVLLFTTCQRSF